MTQGFQLVVLAGESQIVRQFDQARVVIGRSMVCDLALDSAQLSRKHAVIVREPRGWVIQDLKSHHGVMVNDMPLTGKPLADGDRIVLAPHSALPTVLEFRLPGAARRALPQAILSDESGPTSVLASIDLRELSKTFDQPGREKQIPIDFPPDTGAGRRPPSPSKGSWPFEVLGLFKSASEILLAHEHLQDVLGRIVDLIGEYVPGRRVAFCTYDASSGEIVPRCFSRESPRDPEAGRSLGAEEAERPLSISRSIILEAVRARKAMLVAGADEDPRFNAAMSVRQMGIRSAISVPLYHEDRVTSAIYVDSQRDADPLDSRDLEVLTVLGMMLAAGMAQLSLRSDIARERSLRGRLARYNSPQVVEQILKLAPRDEDDMLAEEHDVSALFADISGFSALAETRPAAEVVRVLNLIFERWTADVFERDGTLDKYIGDAVMAVFGAPLRQADHARRAVATALAMQRTLEAWNLARPQEPALQMRIGINSGRVIAGDIGSKLRKAYTVIGDVVNIASRLETSVAQPGQIVIGQATFEQLEGVYACQPLGEVLLRGKRQAIRAYRVLPPA